MDPKIEIIEAAKELDPARVKRIKSRLNRNLKEFAKREELDVNRLEQELIYYIEKLDISEEKVRLASHLNYFSEILNSNKSMGKKMNFIAQEIGRLNHQDRLSRLAGYKVSPSIKTFIMLYWVTFFNYLHKHIFIPPKHNMPLRNLEASSSRHCTSPQFSRLPP